MNNVKISARYTVLFAFLLLATLAAIVFWDVLFSPGILYGQDIIEIGYPLASFRKECLASGIPPIWNPHLMCGFPQMSGAPFYPTDYIDSFFSISKLSAVRYSFHTLMAGFLMFLLLRRLKLRLAPAVLGAVAFMYSGFFVSKIYGGHGGAFSSGVWIPLTFLCLDRLLETRRTRDAVLFGAAIGLQVLGEHMQYVFYTVLAAGPFALYRLWPEIKQRPYPQKLMQLGGLALIAVLFAVMTSAAFLLPFKEMTSASNRAGGTSYEYASSLSLPPANLLSAFVPNIWGSPASHNAVFGAIYWDAALYIGLIPLIFALIAIRWCTDRTARFFKWLAFASLLLALGSYLPTYKLIYHIPGFAMIRAPSKILFIYTLAMTVLSAYGLQVLMTQVGQRRSASQTTWLPPLARRIDRLFRVGAIIFASAFVLYAVAKPLIMSLGREMIIRSKPEPERYIAKINSLYMTQLGSIFVAAIVAVLAAFVVRAMLHRRVSVRFASGALIALSFIDLMLYADPLIEAVLPEKYYGFNRDVVRFLKKDKDVFRILPVDVDSFRMNQATITDLDSVNGYYPIIMERYGRLAQSIDGEEGEMDVSVLIGNYRSKMLDMLNVKYVLSRQELTADDLILVRPGPIKVYINVNYLPRAFLVRGVLHAQNGDEAFRVVTSSTFDPRKTVVVEGETSGFVTKAAKGPDYLRITASSPVKKTIKLQAASPAYLFISEQYNPGWQVSLDGKPATIYRANYAFRAIPVPAGRHTITMQLDPVSRRVGVTLSTIAVLILFGVISLMVIESVTKRSGERTGEGSAERGIRSRENLTAD